MFILIIIIPNLEFDIGFYRILDHYKFMNWNFFGYFIRKHSWWSFDKKYLKSLKKNYVTWIIQNTMISINFTTQFHTDVKNSGNKLNNWRKNKRTLSSKAYIIRNEL